MQVLNGLTPQERDARRARLAQSFCVFLFLFVTLRGWTTSLRILLGTHSPELVDQYAWPTERVWLFTQMAVVVILGTLWHLRRIFQGKPEFSLEPTISTTIPHCLYAILVGVTIIGIIAVLPTNVGMLYPVFLAGGLIAFATMNKRLNSI